MLHETRVLHLEPTDVCQAACPACARELDYEFDQSQKHHLTVEMIDRIVPKWQIQKLDKMFMCGNYGDPAAGKYTLDIYRYFREINPEIVLGMNTNGAIQNTSWWQALGELFHRQRDYVVFSIDGLEDTNSVYRKGVDWHKLIANARSYISTGASAHWDMLIYRHNEHQVKECENLAREMGFTWFRAKVSKRQLVDGLESPVHWTPSPTQTSRIDCHALREQSMYIDAQGRYSPCCWLGSRQSKFETDFSLVQATWTTNRPNPICQQTCGTVSSNATRFDDQWKIEIQLR